MKKREESITLSGRTSCQPSRKADMDRTVFRKMPDGRVVSVQPFHVSLEGLKSAIICREEEDYDAVEKILCVCSHRKNILIIIHAIVSNHAHVAVLAESLAGAQAYAGEVKRMIAMWSRNKYGDKNLMKGVDAKAIGLDNNWHVRNALAYIPRNAMDNGCNVNEYRWSGYRAMFRQKSEPETCRFRRVSSLNKRERETILHTCDKLEGVDWLLDQYNHLVPDSFCDSAYLEQVFEGDQAFFLKTIGGQNSAEMKHCLIDQPRTMMPDTEFFKAVNDISTRWFQMGLSDIPLEKKIRLLSYVRKTMKTSIPQLARVFGLSREKVSSILG